MEVPGDCAVLVEGEGRGVDDNFSAPHEAILAVVDEADAAAIDLGRSLRAAGLHLVSADVEHVAEVGLHPDGTFDLDRLGAAIFWPPRVCGGSALFGERGVTGCPVLWWRGA